MCKSYCFYCVRYISCDYRWFQWLGYNWLRTLSAIIDLYSTNSIQFIQTQTHNHPLTPTVSGICIFWHAGSDPETHFMKHSNNLKVKKGRRRHGSNPAGREGTYRVKMGPAAESGLVGRMIRQTQWAGSHGEIWSPGEYYYNKQRTRSRN